MILPVTCKHCDTDQELDLTAVANGIRCTSCGAEATAETAASVADAIESLASALAGLRTDFRAEVLLESDDLPPPHGFDADYILPEDHRKLAHTAESADPGAAD